MADKNIAKKEKAIEIMKKMDIYKPYIKGFRESDKVCFFEGFGGFWIDQEPELHEKMKAIEEKHKCKVYAVTHEYMGIGVQRSPQSLSIMPFFAPAQRSRHLVIR